MKHIPAETQLKSSWRPTTNCVSKPSRIFAHSLRPSRPNLTWKHSAW